MKKLFALVLVIMMFAGMAAYASEANEGGPLYDSLKGILGEAVDFEAFEIAYCDEEMLTLNPVDYEVLEELTCTIKLGDGTVLDLPIVYSDFLAAGWNPATAQWADVAEARTLGNDTFANAAGETIYAVIVNPTAEARALADTWVKSVTVGDYYTAKFDVNGVTGESTAADVIAAFGQPSIIEYSSDEDYSALMFTYNSADNTLKVNIDTETAAVLSMTYGVNADKLA